jgi:hypothetical protein
MLTAFAIALALGGDAPPVDRRAELQRFSGRLEQRVAAACRPAEPMAFLTGLPETRFVYIDGIGAIFLLPPRALPVASLPKAGQAAPEISVSGAPTGPQVVVLRGKRPSDLTDLEARIRETRKEAERMRAQADAAFADAERQLMAELRPGGSEPTVALGLPLPWTLFLTDEADDTRAPEQVEREVQEALVTTILEDSTLLRSLLPSDLVTVSVDLVSRPQPWVRAKPVRTITVRVHKADLDAFTAGRIGKDELLNRVQTKAY